MFKQHYLVKGLASCFIFMISASKINALSLDEETRLVPIDSSGRKILLTPKELKRGKRLFNNACAICHVGGLTKTNPNLGLDRESLNFANPPRNNIRNLMIYFMEPQDYNGVERSNNEVHPNIINADVFPKMRTLTNQDLFEIAGYILVQTKVGNEKWGGDKIYY